MSLMEASKQELLDRRYLRMATIWAENSYCVRRQVGAILVKDDMIISDGYNGTPSGMENVCEDEDGLTKPYVLHAEQMPSQRWPVAIIPLRIRPVCHGIAVYGV